MRDYRRADKKRTPVVNAILCSSEETISFPLDTLWSIFYSSAAVEESARSFPDIVVSPACRNSPRLNNRTKIPQVIDLIHPSTRCNVKDTKVFS